MPVCIPCDSAFVDNFVNLVLFVWDLGMHGTWGAPDALLFRVAATCLALRTLRVDLVPGFKGDHPVCDRVSR